MTTRSKLIRLTAVLGILVGMSSIPALATDGNLPGGTSISVDIDPSLDGTFFAYPPGDIAMSGTASVGEGLPQPDTLIVYVADVSGSTQLPGGACGNPNGDAYVNSVLDCEIMAAKALNTSAIALGTVGEVGLGIFGEGGNQADVQPLAGNQILTAPGADLGGAVGVDMDEVLNSLQLGGINQFTAKVVGGNSTNFAAGLTSAVGIVTASAKPSRMIVFMSDGQANDGADISTVVVPADVTIYTFAVGSGSTCSGDPVGLGSLDEMADMGNGQGYCTPVTDPAALPDILPGVINAQLTGLGLSVDGGAEIDISGTALPALPQIGPASVTWSYNLLGQLPGIYDLCVTAYGSDAGGTGDVTECVTVTVADINLAPVAATNELGTPGQTHSVTATVAAGMDGGVAGVLVGFEILTGPNAGAVGSGSTDALGEVDFAYTATQGLAGLGTDTIEACFTDDLGVEVCDTATKLWQDTTPPVVACDQTTNPHGKTIPPGVNPDGFFVLTAVDAVDPNPQIYILDTGSNTVFGPFASGTQIKYTESPDGMPEIKPMGSANGKAGAIAWHIIGTGDAAIYAVDFSGNQSSNTMCLVPPPPM